MSVPPRYRRTLNHTKWKALHFIARGVYLNRGRPYCLQDISQGAELHFCADGPHLPQSLRQQPCLTLRVTDVDNTAKGALLTQSGETLHRLSEEEIHDRNALKEIQGTVHDGPRGRAVRTLINLRRDLKNLDLKADSIQQKEHFRRPLMELLCLTPQDFEAVWRIVSRRAFGRVNTADVMRAVTREMGENRKAIFLKEAGKITKTVSYAEFEDYYEGLSIEIPDDEEYINNMRATWSI
uniref:Calcyphosine 2 n=1 Tax=Cyprinus carpio carpio TaxID=630221 RepID=A0A9J7WYZ4_CYPCA